MDILFRLETVAETTVDNHPYQTIMFEYSEAAKEIRKLREQVAETVNYAFILRSMMHAENANGMFDDAISIEFSTAMKEAVEKLKNEVKNPNKGSPVIQLPFGAWQPTCSMPRDSTPILVYLEAPVQCSRIHSAYFTATFGTIGPYFEADAPKVLYWMHQPDAPWNGFKGETE